MFAFQRAGSQVLEKTALGSKRLTFQKMSSKETMYNCRLSKVAVLRGGGGGSLCLMTRFILEQTVSSQGSTKLSQAGTSLGLGHHARDAGLSY